MSERARLAVGEAMEREHRVSERVMRCSGVRVLVVREVVTSGGKGKSVKGASHRKDAGKELTRPPSAMMLAHCVSLAYDDMQVHIRYIRSNNIIRHHRLSHRLSLLALTPAPATTADVYTPTGAEQRRHRRPHRGSGARGLGQEAAGAGPLERRLRVRPRHHADLTGRATPRLT